MLMKEKYCGEETGGFLTGDTHPLPKKNYLQL
jgi:hypothetical protein